MLDVLILAPCKWGPKDAQCKFTKNHLQNAQYTQILQPNLKIL